MLLVSRVHETHNNDLLEGGWLPTHPSGANSGGGADELSGGRPDDPLASGATTR